VARSELSAQRTLPGDRTTSRVAANGRCELRRRNTHNVMASRRGDLCRGLHPRTEQHEQGTSTEAGPRFSRRGHGTVSDRVVGRDGLDDTDSPQGPRAQGLLTIPQTRLRQLDDLRKVHRELESRERQLRGRILALHNAGRWPSPASSRSESSRGSGGGSPSRH
jgi:hypothetical protein